MEAHDAEGMTMALSSNIELLGFYGKQKKWQRSIVSRQICKVEAVFQYCSSGVPAVRQLWVASTAPHINRT